MTTKELEAVNRMYNALLAIGCIAIRLVPQSEPIERAHEIAMSCIREMNTEHTQLIAKAIGLPGRRGTNASHKRNS